MKLSYLTAATVLWASSVQAGVYDLSIDTLDVNFTGTPHQALAINGQIPGPALRFQEGEVVVINVTNKLNAVQSNETRG